MAPDALKRADTDLTFVDIQRTDTVSTARDSLNLPDGQCSDTDLNVVGVSDSPPTHTKPIVRDRINRCVELLMSPVFLRLLFSSLFMFIAFLLLLLVAASKTISVFSLNAGIQLRILDGDASGSATTGLDFGMWGFCFDGLDLTAAVNALPNATQVISSIQGAAAKAITSAGQDVDKGLSDIGHLFSRDLGFTLKFGASCHQGYTLDSKIADIL
ncbi:hypothetical protein C8R47DRAFT_171210 [Mycena vitilis]|nr:hypothetical protein C8R47DRAFT_171210 [Mycena vitilis]